MNFHVERNLCYLFLHSLWVYILIIFGSQYCSQIWDTMPLTCFNKSELWSTILCILKTVF